VGSNLSALLFENLNPFTMESIRMNIKDMLNSFEPRINQIGVQIDNNNLNSIRVTVTFNITGISENESLDFYLERLR
jgi:predicted component of type VI protein secretion system